jgi:hypothetical protein
VTAVGRTTQQEHEAPVHHPTPEELAAEVWEDESPAPGSAADGEAGDA